MATVETDLFPPDPDPVENAPPKPGSHRGIVPQDDAGHESLPETGK